MPLIVLMLLAFRVPARNRNSEIVCLNKSILSIWSAILLSDKSISVGPEIALHSLLRHSETQCKLLPVRFSYIGNG